MAKMETEIIRLAYESLLSPFKQAIHFGPAYDEAERAILAMAQWVWEGTWTVEDATWVTMYLYLNASRVGIAHFERLTRVEARRYDALGMFRAVEKQPGAEMQGIPYKEGEVYDGLKQTFDAIDEVVAFKMMGQFRNAYVQIEKKRLLVKVSVPNKEGEQITTLQMANLWNHVVADSQELEACMDSPWKTKKMEIEEYAKEKAAEIRAHHKAWMATQGLKRLMGELMRLRRSMFPEKKRWFRRAKHGEAGRSRAAG